MDNDTPTDPLADSESEKADGENSNSPKSLSEFVKNKIKLALDPETKPKYTIEIQKPLECRSFDTKKSSKSMVNNMDKGWLVTTPEEGTVHPIEKPANVIIRVKILDRSLIVNGYPEDVSLYTISRAWMKNQNTSLANSQYSFLAILAAASKRQNNGAEILQKLQNGEAKYICSMPEVPPRVGAENSRIPTAEQLGIKHEPFTEVLDKIMKRKNESTDDEPPTSKEDLLAQHKRRWKKVKYNWIHHVRNSDKQYEVNFAIIETLFASQMKIVASFLEAIPENFAKNS